MRSSKPIDFQLTGAYGNAPYMIPIFFVGLDSIRAVILKFRKSICDGYRKR